MAGKTPSALSGREYTPGLVTSDGSAWDRDVLDALGIPEEVLGTIVDSTALVAPATALTGDVTTDTRLSYISA